MSEFHEPVLLAKSLEGLNVKSKGTYVDVTFGGGGHSRAILNSLFGGLLISFDQDDEAIKNKIMDDNRFIMVNQNFRYLREELKRLNIYRIDGLIADLGVSSYHFTDNGRGFSLKYDAPVDMRMDQTLETNGAHVLNNYSANHLMRIFKDHSDFHTPHSIVNLIIKFREKRPINTIFDFKKIFQGFVSARHQNKFFARLFQAVRIEVNDEINALKELLTQSLDLLKPSGRLVIISYHSIEDKIVKRFMRFGNFSGVPKKDFFGNHCQPFKIITKKPIVPSREEVQSNNKSRSAKLRIAEKL